MAKRCPRCYQSDVNLDNDGVCDQCAWERNNLSQHTGRSSKTFDDVMRAAPREGREFKVAAAQNGLDPKIVEELALLHKQICYERNELKGTVSSKTPDERLVEIFGDPDDFQGEARKTCMNLHCWYLSASVTAASWKGWFAPRYVWNKMYG